MLTGIEAEELIAGAVGVVATAEDEGEILPGARRVSVLVVGNALRLGVGHRQQTPAVRNCAMYSHKQL